MYLNGSKSNLNITNHLLKHVLNSKLSQERSLLKTMVISIFRFLNMSQLHTQINFTYKKKPKQAMYTALEKE